MEKSKPVSIIKKDKSYLDSNDYFSSPKYVSSAPSRSLLSNLHTNESAALSSSPTPFSPLSYTPPKNLALFGGEKILNKEYLKKSSNVEVYKTLCNGTPKVVKKTTWNDSHKRCYIFNELDAYQTIQSIHVPKLYGFHTNIHSSYVLMELEWINGTDLKKCTATIDTFQQLAQGLADIFDAGFVHGDIKPENIMISSTSHIYYIDFGYSCSINPLLESGKFFRGSLPYILPELLKKTSQVTNYTPELLKHNDLYGLANVFYYLLTGHPIHKIYPYDNQRTYIERVTTKPPSINSMYQEFNFLIYLMIHNYIEPKGVIKALEFIKEIHPNFSVTNQ